METTSEVKNYKIDLLALAMKCIQHQFKNSADYREIYLFDEFCKLTNFKERLKLKYISTTKWWQQFYDPDIKMLNQLEFNFNEEPPLQIIRIDTQVPILQKFNTTIKTWFGFIKSKHIYQEDVDQIKQLKDLYPNAIISTKDESLLKLNETFYMISFGKLNAIISEEEYKHIVDSYQVVQEKLALEEQENKLQHDIDQLKIHLNQL